jgi:hypothetical protein
MWFTAPCPFGDMIRSVDDFVPGGHSEEETPVPIPNTEVKGLSGNGTAVLVRGRVARCRGIFSGPSGPDRGIKLRLGALCLCATESRNLGLRRTRHGTCESMHLGEVGG